MLEKIPSKQEAIELIGADLHLVWEKLCIAIEEKYNMECFLNSGGKAWIYERKYRRGGKTLCSLYMKDNCIGFMVIFGQVERDKFELNRESFSLEIQKAYDEAKTFHDGKWIMFYPVDFSLIDEFMSLLEIKRKPNRK